MNFVNSQLPDRLSELLTQPLPGWRVQSAFQPELSYGRHFGPPPAMARTAAVVALLYPHADAWHVPLTLRPDTLADHPGQISLPGGSVQLEESGAEAALRELHEELGVRLDTVRILGQLSPLYLFNSNYRVTAWVAATDVRPQWQPQLAEVAELLEVRLGHLVDPRSHAVTQRVRYGVRSACPGFQCGRHHVWGFTALVLAELAWLAAQAGETAAP